MRKRSDPDIYKEEISLRHFCFLGIIITWEKFRHGFAPGQRMYSVFINDQLM